MLKIVLPSMEEYDSVRNRFFITKKKTVVLEHSLLAISKWEAETKKSFLSTETKSNEDLLTYIRCMSLEEIDDSDIARFSNEDVKKIEAYIRDPMTATRFSDDGKGKGHKKDRPMTSEEIYCAMAMNGIPFSCEMWHINRLLTLLRVCSVRNSPQKKMSKRELLSKQSALNAARRKKYNSAG